MNDRHVDAAARLQDYINGQIPLSRAMQLAVTRWNGRKLEVSAPIAPNRNHKATAFGGSLYSLAVVSCWGLFTLRLWEEELDGEIVIQQAHASYLAPVASDMLASCEFNDETRWQSLTNQLRRRGRARIALEAEVLVEKQAAFRLQGDFVAHLIDSAG